MTHDMAKVFKVLESLAVLRVRLQAVAREHKNPFLSDRIERAGAKLAEAAAILSNDEARGVRR